MGLSVTQQFLVEASRAAGYGDHFRWDAVGRSLGYTATEAERAVRSLNERKLVLLLRDGAAQLSPAGKKLAGELEAKQVARGGGGGGGTGARRR